MSCWWWLDATFLTPCVQLKLSSLGFIYGKLHPKNISPGNKIDTSCIKIPSATFPSMDKCHIFTVAQYPQNGELACASIQLWQWKSEVCCSVFYTRLFCTACQTFVAKKVAQNAGFIKQFTLLTWYKQIVHDNRKQKLYHVSCLSWLLTKSFPFLSRVYFVEGHWANFSYSQSTSHVTWRSETEMNIRNPLRNFQHSNWNVEVSSENRSDIRI